MSSDDPSREVGVGPHPQPWPNDPRLDPVLLAEGDRRNVVDAYRYWRRDAIVADLDRRRHSFHVAIENWQHDLNIGTVVRNANAFLAAEVHIIGKRRWNRRGAMVTDRYQHVRHHATTEAFVRWAEVERLARAAASMPGTRCGATALTTMTTTSSSPRPNCRNLSRNSRICCAGTGNPILPTRSAFQRAMHLRKTNASGRVSAPLNGGATLTASLPSSPLCWAVSHAMHARTPAGFANSCWLSMPGCRHTASRRRKPGSRQTSSTSGWYRTSSSRESGTRYETCSFDCPFRTVSHTAPGL